MVSLFKQLWLYEENRHNNGFWYLVFHINERAHVKFLWESHAVVELNSMHSGVVKIKSLQLECQQVGKVQKSQTLCGHAQGLTKISQERQVKEEPYLHELWLPRDIYNPLTFRASHFFWQRSQKYWLGPSRVSGWINACNASSCNVKRFQIHLCLH